MNYFELYEIPVSFDIDALALKRQFYALSRQFHPDLSAHRADADQPAHLEEAAAQNNEAYRVLSDFDLRTNYILQEYGNFSEADKAEALPTDFLMDMMDWNETLSDLALSPDETAKKELIAQISAVETNLFLEAKPLINSYKIGDDLTEIKKIYLKRRYLLRMRERLLNFASL